MAINGQFTLGALVAFLSAHEKLYDPWQELRLFYQEYQNAHVVYQQITRLFDNQELPALAAPRLIHINPAYLELAHIYYTLPGHITLLRNVSLTIHRGQDVALVGASGCGKSTLALLLAGLYRSTEGTIHLEGQDMNCCSAEFISSQIAMIPQRPFIFSGTISENIMYGLPDSAASAGSSGEIRHRLRQIIHNIGLEQDLLNVGLALARIILEMLQQTATDESFFSRTPMEEEELGKYQDIIGRLDSAVMLTREEKNYLMILALRYIPAKHGLVRLKPELERKILAARHYFLNEIQHVVNCLCRHDNLDRLCNNHGVSLHDKPHEFNTYCYSGYLYKHNIRTNILLGSVKKTFEDILRIKDLAWDTFKREGLLDEIIDLGLEFFVGSQGSHLSGGQKQKIAIARALLTDTPIIIMDEATASLDNISQSMIQDFISTSFTEKTIISIIHRLDLAQFYDRIVVMDNGGIIENGSYDELMQSKGAFYQLYHSDKP